MENQNTGGSYIRQKDGSLKLVDRTEEVQPEWVAEDPGTPAPTVTAVDTPAPSKKKDA